MRALPTPDPALFERFGAASALRLQVFPYARLGNATLIVACRAPSPEAVQRIKALYPRPLWHFVEDDAFFTLSEPLRLQAIKEAEQAQPLALSSRRLKDAIGFRLFCSFLLVWLALWPLQMLTLGLCLGAATLCANAVLKLCAALASRAIPNLPLPEKTERLPFISLLLPLYREEAIAAHLVPHLAALNYPRTRLEICFLVEEQDTATKDALSSTALPPEARVVIVPHGSLRTKPRAMNYALPFLHGSLVGIYDAEDVPAPDHLLKVAAYFARTGPQTACLQGVLDYHNPSATLLTRCFTLEYASWFRVLLKGLDRLGFVVPLGGTTLYLRRNVLEEMKGWDAHNVTEDADLGLRLARAGYRTEVIDIVTMEEANGFIWPWVKQRSRWLKGFALTWAAHMGDPIALYRALGPKRFWGFQLMFAGNIVQTALAPLLWSLWLIPLGVNHPALYAMPRPLLIAIAIVFAAAEAIQWITYAAGAARGRRNWLLLWVPLMHLYFPLASLALAKGLWEILRRPFYWDKTLHGLFAPPPAAKITPERDHSHGAEHPP